MVIPSLASKQAGRLSGRVDTATCLQQGMVIQSLASQQAGRLSGRVDTTTCLELAR